MQRILLTAVCVRQHTASFGRRMGVRAQAGEEEEQLSVLSKLAAVASGYWSSGGLALLIWFTNRTRRPPHIVTHYYYYSQTLTHTHTHTYSHTPHTHTHPLSLSWPQCFWQTHLVHLLHLLRRLPHFNCFCSHTNGSRTPTHTNTHTHTHTQTLVKVCQSAI